MAGARRQSIRAFQHIDCCRTALFISELLEAGTPAATDRLKKLWAERYPSHAQLSGDRSIDRRISTSLSRMSSAGIIKIRSNVAEVHDPELLAMAVRNLAIVEDPTTKDETPTTKWRALPEVPDDLKPHQKIPGHLLRRRQVKVDVTSPTTPKTAGSR